MPFNFSYRTPLSCFDSSHVILFCCVISTPKSTFETKFKENTILPYFHPAQFLRDCIPLEVNSEDWRVGLRGHEENNFTNCVHWTRIESHSTITNKNITTLICFLSVSSLVPITSEEKGKTPYEINSLENYVFAAFMEYCNTKLKFFLNFLNSLNYNIMRIGWIEVFLLIQW